MHHLAKMKYFIIGLFVVGAFALPRKHISRRGPMKIEGGKDATQGQFPYQLSFQDTSYIPSFHFCGASIYDASTAITAGHCVYGDNYHLPQNLDIVAGDLSLSDTSGLEQRRTVTKIILHEHYNSAEVENDIALLKITDPFDLNDNVSPLGLAKSGANFDGDTCVVSGWGTLHYFGESPDVLQFVDVPIVSDEQCKVSYEDEIYDSMICAGEAGKDSCQGDSGGPLVCQGVLTGIVSWGYQCGVEGYPGVYTEVSYFYDWILANV